MVFHSAIALFCAINMEFPSAYLSLSYLHPKNAHIPRKELSTMSIFPVFLRLDNPLNMSAPRKTPWTAFLSFSYVGIDTKCHVPAQLSEGLFCPEFCAAHVISTLQRCPLRKTQKVATSVFVARTYCTDGLSRRKTRKLKQKALLRTMAFRDK